MKYVVIFLVLIGFGLVSQVYALEFSPLISTNNDEEIIQESVVGKPIKFHLTLSNKEPDPLELTVNFATYMHDELLDSHVQNFKIINGETQTASYQFVPPTEGNYLTSVFVEYTDGTIPYNGDAKAFLALDATKVYKRQTVTMYSDSSDDCSVLCTNPAILTIEGGTVVEWINESPNYRSLATGQYIEEENGISWTSDHRLQSSQIGPGEKFSFLFLEPGNYQYFVAEHRLNQVAGAIYVTALDSTTYRTIDSLEQIMNEENSSIPITSLSVNEENSIITVGIDNGKDPNISLGVYKKMIRNQIGNVYFKVISHTKDHIIEFPLKQFREGIPSNEIDCRNGLVLILKINGSPACIKSESHRKLFERGWTKLVPVQPEIGKKGTLDFQVNNENYKIKYDIKGGSLDKIIYDEQANSIIFRLNQPYNGELTVDLPRTLMEIILQDPDGDYFVLLDGEETDFDSEDIYFDKKISTKIPQRIHEMELIGSFLSGPDS